MHGAFDELAIISCTNPRISAREPEPPVDEYGSGAEKIWPDVTVKLAADPMLAPLESRNEIEPLHEAAVPLDGLGARFTTLIWAVSVAARPTGGKLN